MSKKKKFVCELPGSEFSDVTVKLFPAQNSWAPPGEEPELLADLIFPVDGMSVKIEMMQTDLEVLGKFLLECAAYRKGVK